MATSVTNQVSLAGGANVTLSQVGNVVSISAPATRPMEEKLNYGNVNPGGIAQFREEFYFNTTPNQVGIAFGQTTSYLTPALFRIQLSWNYMRIPMSIATANTQTSVVNTGGAVRSASTAATYNVHIYSRGTGANSMSLMSVASTSASMAIRWSVTSPSGGNSSAWTASYQMSYPMSSTAQATSSTSVGGASAASFTIGTSWLSAFTGERGFDIPWSATIDPGAYWIGIGSSTDSATQSAGMSVLSNVKLNPFSIHAETHTAAVSFGEVGAASNASIQFPMGMGSFTAVAGATTASVALSVVSVSSDTPVIPFALIKMA